MPIDLKNYEPALMQGADIGISSADLSIDDLTVADDAGITGDLTVTGAIVSDSTTDTSSTITGAIQTDGGVGIAKALWVGTTSRLVGNVTANGTLTVDGASTLTGAVNYKRQVTDTGGAFATPVVLTAAQSGRVIILDDAAGLDFTLPAIAAADVGVHFKFIATVTVSSNSYRMTAQTGDIMFGAVWLADFDTANTGAYFTADGSNDLICTLNGGTTGGKMGSWLEFIATSATQWTVTGVLFGNGSLATPFS